MHYTCLTLSSSDHRSVLELVNYVYEFHGLVQFHLLFFVTLIELRMDPYVLHSLLARLKFLRSSSGSQSNCHPMQPFLENILIESQNLHCICMVTYPIGGYEFFHDYGRQKRKHLELHQVSLTLWSRSNFSFWSLRNGHGLGPNL